MYVEQLQNAIIKDIRNYTGKYIAGAGMFNVVFLLKNGNIEKFEINSNIYFNRQKYTTSVLANENVFASIVFSIKGMSVFTKYPKVFLKNKYLEELKIGKESSVYLKSELNKNSRLTSYDYVKTNALMNNLCILEQWFDFSKWMDR